MGYSANITSNSIASYTNTEMLRSHRAYSAYTTDILEGRAARAVHKELNPKGVVRESRDSATHPESLAIGVFFDVTGSMGAIPRELQRRLVNLMSLLVTRGYVAHPQVLFGAIGDATCDAGPLQVGQFEAGLDMDKDLERVWVESGGGGQHTESYELAHYFFMRHTVTDCWEKRSKKGYLFTMGDEMPYSAVSRHQIHQLIGDTPQSDIPHEDVIAELQQKWDVYHLIVDTQTSRGDSLIAHRWNALLPGHVISLRDPKNVGEVIGMVVGIAEGRVTDPETDLAQLGMDADSLRAVLDTIAPLAHARGIRLTA